MSMALASDLQEQNCYELLQRTTDIKSCMNKLKRDITLSFRCCKRDFGVLGKELVTALEQNQARQRALMDALEREQSRNRQHAMLSDVESLRVLCRVRSRSKDNQVAVHMTSVHEIQVYRTGTTSLVPLNDSSSSSPPCKRFSFDRVVGDNVSQSELYQQEIEPLVQAAATQGQHACVLAYGPTGTGKTRTLLHSSPNEWGVVFQAVESLFQHIQRLCDVKITLQMVEIYNEEIYDLLGENSRESESTSVQTGPGYLANCPIGELRHGDRGVYLRNVASRSVESVQDVVAAMEHGQHHRTGNGSGELARSHRVITMHLERGRVDGRRSECGRLVFVELAGSERLIPNTDTMTPSAMREAQHINKSLSAVGDVLAALQAKDKYIPYRNTKLTHLLQDSLSHSNPSTTLLLVHVNNHLADVNETINSLKFASRVSEGKRPHRRSERLEVHRLQGIITSQSAQLQALQDKLDAEVELRRRHEKRLEEYRQEEHRRKAFVPSTPQSKSNPQKANGTSRGLAPTTPEQLYGTRRWSSYTKRTTTPTSEGQENTPENLLPHASETIVTAKPEVNKSQITTSFPTPVLSTPLRRSRRLSHVVYNDRTQSVVTPRRVPSSENRKRKPIAQPVRSILKKQKNLTAMTQTIDSDNNKGTSKQVSFDLMSSNCLVPPIAETNRALSSSIPLRVPLNPSRVPMVPSRVRTSQSIGMSSPAMRVKTAQGETTPSRHYHLTSATKPNWNGRWR